MVSLCLYEEILELMRSKRILHEDSHERSEMIWIDGTLHEQALWVAGPVLTDSTLVTPWLWPSASPHVRAYRLRQRQYGFCHIREYEHQRIDVRTFDSPLLSQGLHPLV